MGLVARVGYEDSRRGCVATVERWTGREAKALRTAKRMSLEAFAAHLGISERALSTWEARGEDITIRAVNQAALDTSLRASTPDVHERFVRLTDAFETVLPQQNGAEPYEPPPQRHERHPNDGKQMALVEGGVYLSGPENKPVWLPSFYIDVFPVTNSDYARFVAATGHVARRRLVRSLGRERTPQCTAVGEDRPRSTRRHLSLGQPAHPGQVQLPRERHRLHYPRQPIPQGVSTYGVYDLCGNTWEWTSTRTQPNRYELKAGAFTSPFTRATPSSFNDDTGFRCCIAETALQDKLRFHAG